jgi:hypothetical protein
MKEEGIKTEIKKELLYNIMQAQASVGNKEGVETTRKNMIKFLFPEVKDEDESLMEKARENLTKFGDKLRISVDTKNKLDPLEVNRQFNKS